MVVYGLALFVSLAFLNLLATPSAQAAMWLTNGAMITGRTLFTATLLSSGKILVAGGSVNGVPTSSAELYDPQTGTWASTGSLNAARYGHKAVMLPNGKVLALGGYGANYLSSAELYDPQTGIWTSTGSMNIGRYICTATLLRNGKVLAAGGSSTGTNTPTAEIYDPATGFWSQTGTMQDGRVEHTATLLADGRVLVAGGIGSAGSTNAPVGFYETLASMELYDPLQGTWTSTGPLIQARLGHTATLLPGGQVLFTGGTTNGPVTVPFSSAEIYDPSTGTDTTVPPMNSPHFLHSAELLPNGTVIVIGGMADSAGNATNSTEIYNPSSNTWSLTNALNTPRFLHNSTLLPNGEILVEGGTINNFNVPLASTELYDPTIAPSTGTWTNTGSMQTPRYDFTLTLLPGGKVLAAGGQNDNGPSASCELYDPVTGTWAAAAPLHIGRFYHTATLLPNGKVMVTGGLSDSPGLTVATPEFYDPNSGTWSTNRSMNIPREGNTATLLANGKVLVAGGTGNIHTNTAELYDPVANTWTLTGDMIVPRNFHKAVLLTNGDVLVVGGDAGESFPTNLPSAELYDPASGIWSAAGTIRGDTEFYTAAALLPNDNVLVPGMDTNGLPVADLYNSTNGTWTATGSPHTNHFFPTLTVLPNGKALLAGDDPAPEIYDPATGQWTVTTSMNVERLSLASALLPDGRLFAAGGRDTNENFTSTAEVYDIGLNFSNSWRPQITNCPANAYLGNPLVIAGSGFRSIPGASGGNIQSSPTDFPVVQLRAIESGQMTFLNTTNWSTNSFASLSITNFPMGYAMATVFVGGIPSTSAIVDITISNSIPLPVMTVLKNTKITANGFQFTFTNTPGVMLNVLASTNPSTRLTNWTDLGPATETSPGQFQFIDPQAGANRRRFYILLSP